MKQPALHLDFVHRPPSGWRRAGWLALVPAALVADRYEAAAGRSAAATGRHEALTARARPARSAAPPPADAKTLLDVARANAIIDHLTVPWDALFDAVEAADARTLGVLSVTPNARERTLRIAGEARSLEDVLGYVDRMAAQPVLSNVHLQSYGAASRDGASVVTFTVAATWRAAP